MTINVTTQQAKVLRFLHACGRAGPRAVANYLYDDVRRSQQAYLILVRLEEKGLVQRMLRNLIHPTARPRYELTDAGREYVVTSA